MKKILIASIISLAVLGCEETYDLRTGDCEDYVILAMQFAADMGIETFMAVERIPELAMAHAVLKYNGKYYEVILGDRITVIEDEISYVYSLDYIYSIMHERRLVSGRSY